MRRKSFDGGGTVELLNRSRRNLVLALAIFPAAGLVGFTGSMSVRSILSDDAHKAVPPSPSDEDADEATPSETDAPDSAHHSREQPLMAEIATEPAVMPLAVAPA